MRDKIALRASFDFDRRDNRRMESEYYASFYHLEPDAQGCDIIHSDSPDFRLTSGGQVMGAEITKVFKPDARQDIESTQERILDYASKSATEMGLPSANVALFPNFRHPLRDTECRRIADAVAQVVAHNMPPDGNSAKLDMRPGQPSEVDLILVHRRDDIGLGRWHWCEASTVDKTATVLVQHSINRKAKLLPAYLRVCSECWLLVVSDGLRPSGKLELGEHFESHVYASPFTRTYVLDFGKGKLYRLRTSNEAT